VKTAVRGVSFLAPVPYPEIYILFGRPIAANTSDSGEGFDARAAFLSVHDYFEQLSDSSRERRAPPSHLAQAGCHWRTRLHDCDFRLDIIRPPWRRSPTPRGSDAPGNSTARVSLRMHHAHLLHVAYTYFVKGPLGCRRVLQSVRNTSFFLSKTSLLLLPVHY
jgi:hypothetical protein